MKKAVFVSVVIVVAVFLLVILVFGIGLQWPLTVDKSCSVDSDCEIKSVHCSGCGEPEVYGCANKESEEVRCFGGNLSLVMCAVPKPKSCECVNNICTARSS